MRNSFKSGIYFFSMVSFIDSAAVCAEQISETENSNNSDILFTIFRDDIALSANQLDRQRGGFINKNGFKISIGFEKVVVVNGKLEAKSQFFVPLNNIKDQNTSQFKGLATAMAALQERLGKEDNEIQGNHTPDQLDDVTDNLNSLTEALSIPTIGAGAAIPQANSLTLTSGTKSGGDNYTDALLSMLSAGQSLLDTPNTAPYSTIPSTIPASPTDSTPPPGGSSQPDIVTPGTAAPAPQGTQLITINNPEDIPTENPLSNDLIINSGSHNELSATPNYSDSMTSVVMNSQDSSLIQSFQLLNIKIDNLGQYRSKSINALVLPQIIHSLR